MSKDPSKMSPSEFEEHIRMEEILYEKEQEILAAKDKNKYVPISDIAIGEVEFDGSMSSFNDEIDNAVGIGKVIFDEHGRQLYPPDGSVFEVMDKNRVSMVGRNGEHMKSALDIYNHYDLNISAEKRASLDGVGVKMLYYNMRKNFGEKYLCFFNTMIPPSAYADFKGLNYRTVLKKIREFELEVISIYGINFVLLEADELDDFDNYLMEKRILCDCNSEESENNRLKTLRVWEIKHNKKFTKEIENNVKTWIDGSRYSIVPLGDRFKLELATAHEQYERWCRKHNKEPLSRIVFTKRISLLGFRLYRKKVRGFYFYDKNAQNKENDKK